MVSAEIQSWTDKTITAVSGTLVLSQESSRDVARHALKKLFALTNNELDASLKIIQEINDFSVRRRLLEVFRQSFVEASEDFTSPLFSQVIFLTLVLLKILTRIYCDYGDIQGVIGNV